MQKLVIEYVYAGEESKAETSLLGTFTKQVDCLSEQDWIRGEFMSVFLAIHPTGLVQVWA